MGVAVGMKSIPKADEQGIHRQLFDVFKGTQLEYPSAWMHQPQLMYQPLGQNASLTVAMSHFGGSEL